MLKNVSGFFPSSEICDRRFIMIWLYQQIWKVPKRWASSQLSDSKGRLLQGLSRQITMTMLMMRHRQNSFLFISVVNN